LPHLAEEGAENGKAFDAAGDRPALPTGEPEEKHVGDQVHDPGGSHHGSLAALHGRRDLALEVLGDAGDGKDDPQHGKDADQKHREDLRQRDRQTATGKPGRDGIGDGADGEGHLSTSGRTMSKDPISATRSAIIRPGTSFSKMDIAVKDPVRILTR
jgi:hypothetical protein